jgi:hypothetical protein
MVWLENPPTPQEMSVRYDEEYHQTITMAGEDRA